MKKAFIILLALSLAVLLCACGKEPGGTDFTLPPMNTTGSSSTEPTADATSSTPEATLPIDGSETPTMQRARFKAAEYLSEIPFSREGLIGMLTEYEKLTRAEAAYGADHCGADWSMEAARMAERYTSVGAYSRVSLKKQLEFEGFEKSEVTYALENAKVDWLAECTELTAQQKSYDPAVTNEAIAKYLTGEGFTMAEIGRVLNG